MSFVIKGSPKFMIKRIGYSEYLSGHTGTTASFTHLPAEGIYFDSEPDAQFVIDCVWPTVGARSAAQVMIARVA